MPAMTRRGWLGVIVIVAVVVVAVLLNRGHQESPATVRIGYLSITASLPLYIADERGFLKDEGLTYELVPIATSNQLVDGIVANNIDAFIEASAVPALAVELQSPGRLKVFSVSSITKDHPFDAVLVKEDSAIKSIQDLSGKKVGVFPGSTATKLLSRFLQDRKIDVSGTTYLPIPPQNQLTALLEGSIDALHAYEPTTAIALARGGIRKVFGSVYAEMLDPNPQGVAAISSSFVTAHPETARKVVHALERGMTYMIQNDADSRKILATRLKLDDKVANSSVFLYMLPHKNIDGTVFQKYADMLTSLGELSGAVNVTNMIYVE